MATSHLHANPGYVVRTGETRPCFGLRGLTTFAGSSWCCAVLSSEPMRLRSRRLRSVCVRGRAGRARSTRSWSAAVVPSLVFGLIFAIGTAVATNLGFLWKHRGAVAAPAVDLHHPIRSAAELFRSKWWAIGWGVAGRGWVAHVGALALVPLSLAQAIIAGGFVVLAVLAERMFGFGLGRRQWCG